MKTSWDAQLQDSLVRMVVPLKREFGMALDLSRMRSDAGYARLVLANAAGSADARLQRYAGVVEAKMFRCDEDIAPSTPTAIESSTRERALRAARALIDATGPASEGLAVRIERARDAAALAALLQQARTLVAAQRGSAAATAFAARARIQEDAATPAP